MAEYYGYAERQRDDYIDWAKVGADVTKKLDDEKNRRETEKAKLDEAQRKSMNVFNTPNIGDNKTLNEVYLNNAEQAKQQQLIWHKELTSGRMSPAEYSRLTQNLLDDNKMFTGVVNKAQEAFTRTKERIDKGIASEIEVAQMKKIQEFTDFNNTAFRVDPKSGKMVVAKKNPDGTVSDNPNDVLSIQGIFSNLGVTVDKFMLEEEVNKDVKFLAKKYQQVIGKGRIQTLDDLRQNPEFQKAIDDAVQAKLVNPNDTASILTQYGNYEISSDVKDKGKEGVIFVDYSKNIPEAVLTPAQEEEAAKIVRSQYEVQIGKSETYRAPVSRGSSSSSNGSSQRVKGNLMDSIAKLYYGNKKERLVAANTIKNYLNKSSKVTDHIDVIGTELRIYDKDGTYYEPYDISELNMSDFIESLAGKVGIQDSRIVEKYKKKYSNPDKYKRGTDDMEQKGETVEVKEEGEAEEAEEAEESYVPYSIENNILKKSKTASKTGGTAR